MCILSDVCCEVFLELLLLHSDGYFLVLMSEIIHFSATEANDAVFCRGSDRDISEQMCNTLLEKSMFTQ